MTKDFVKKAEKLEAWRRYREIEVRISFPAMWREASEMIRRMRAGNAAG